MFLVSFALIWNQLVTFVLHLFLLYGVFLWRMWPLAATLIMFGPGVLVVLDCWMMNADKHMVPSRHNGPRAG